MRVVIFFVTFLCLSSCNQASEAECAKAEANIWEPDTSWQDELRGSKRIDFFKQITDMYGDKDAAYLIMSRADADPVAKAIFIKEHAFYYLRNEILFTTPIDYLRIEWYLKSGVPIFKNYPAMAPIISDIEVSRDQRILDIVERFYKREQHEEIKAIDFLIQNCT